MKRYVKVPDAIKSINWDVKISMETPISGSFSEMPGDMYAEYRVPKNIPASDPIDETSMLVSKSREVFPLTSINNWLVIVAKIYSKIKIEIIENRTHRQQTLIFFRDNISCSEMLEPQLLQNLLPSATIESHFIHFIAVLFI